MYSVLVTAISQLQDRISVSTVLVSLRPTLMAPTRARSVKVPYLVTQTQFCLGQQRVLLLPDPRVKPSKSCGRINPFLCLFFTYLSVFIFAVLVIISRQNCSVDKVRNFTPILAGFVLKVQLLGCKKTVSAKYDHS